jgi:hypothetical protein
MDAANHYYSPQRARPGMFQCEDTELDRRLEVRVFLGDWTIEVDASREWIVIEWEPRPLMIHLEHSLER